MASFVSVITERERVGGSDVNLVMFGESPHILEGHPQLVEAADIIQSRFRFTQFLLEACDTLASSALEELGDAFEVSTGSGLYCVPFHKRDRLPDASFHMTDFKSFCEVFDVLRGEREGGLDDVWHELYEEQGFLTFRLILQK